MKKKLSNSKKIVVAFMALGILFSLSGCQKQTNVSQSVQETQINDDAVGTILLSVNPEIQIKYDAKGRVIDLQGINEDGKKVVSELKDYKNKECDEVVDLIIEKIYKDGYFDEKIDGKTKNVVIKLEAGSSYPNDTFIEDIKESARKAVKSYGVDSSALSVEEKDQTNGIISLEKAKELVLAQLGVKEADFVEKEYELDDGIYELEFTVDGIEYDYEVNAKTGKILKADYEHNDDWNVKSNMVTKSVSKGENITLEEAKEIVFKELGVKEADFYKREYKLENGIYDIEFSVNGKEYDYEVDAKTGKIVKAHEEYDDDYVAPTTGNKENITLEEAKEIVFKELGVKEADFYKKEYGYDDGAYELDFAVDGIEDDYEVEARTGKIIKAEQERDDDYR